MLAKSILIIILSLKKQLKFDTAKANCGPKKAVPKVAAAIPRREKSRRLRKKEALKNNKDPGFQFFAILNGEHKLRFLFVDYKIGMLLQL